MSGGNSPFQNDTSGQENVSGSANSPPPGGGMPNTVNGESRKVRQNSDGGESIMTATTVTTAKGVNFGASSGGNIASRSGEEIRKGRQNSDGGQSIITAKGANFGAGSGTNIASRSGEEIRKARQNSDGKQSIMTAKTAITGAGSGTNMVSRSGEIRKARQNSDGGQSIMTATTVKSGVNGTESGGNIAMTSRSGEIRKARQNSDGGQSIMTANTSKGVIFGASNGGNIASRSGEDVRKVTQNSDNGQPMVAKGINFGAGSGTVFATKSGDNISSGYVGSGNVASTTSGGNLPKVQQQVQSPTEAQDREWIGKFEQFSIKFLNKIFRRTQTEKKMRDAVQASCKKSGVVLPNSYDIMSYSPSPIAPPPTAAPMFQPGMPNPMQQMGGAALTSPYPGMQPNPMQIGQPTFPGSVAPPGSAFQQTMPMMMPGTQQMYGQPQQQFAQYAPQAMAPGGMSPSPGINPIMSQSVTQGSQRFNLNLPEAMEEDERATVTELNAMLNEIAQDINRIAAQYLPLVTPLFATLVELKNRDFRNTDNRDVFRRVDDYQARVKCESHFCLEDTMSRLKILAEFINSIKEDSEKLRKFPRIVTKCYSTESKICQEVCEVFSDDNIQTVNIKKMCKLKPKPPERPPWRMTYKVGNECGLVGAYSTSKTCTKQQSCSMQCAPAPASCPPKGASFGQSTSYGKGQGKCGSKCDCDTCNKATRYYSSYKNLMSKKHPTCPCGCCDPQKIPNICGILFTRFRELDPDLCPLKVEGQSIVDIFPSFTNLSTNRTLDLPAQKLFMTPPKCCNPPPVKEVCFGAKKKYSCGGKYACAQEACRPLREPCCKPKRKKKKRPKPRVNTHCLTSTTTLNCTKDQQKQQAIGVGTMTADEFQKSMVALFDKTVAQNEGRGGSPGPSGTYRQTGTYGGPGISSDGFIGPSPATIGNFANKLFVGKTPDGLDLRGTIQTQTVSPPYPTKSQIRFKQQQQQNPQRYEAQLVTQESQLIQRGLEQVPRYGMQQLPQSVPPGQEGYRSMQGQQIQDQSVQQQQMQMFNQQQPPHQIYHYQRPPPEQSQVAQAPPPTNPQPQYYPQSFPTPPPSPMQPPSPGGVQTSPPRSPNYLNTLPLSLPQSPPPQTPQDISVAPTPPQLTPPSSANTPPDANSTNPFYSTQQTFQMQNDIQPFDQLRCVLRCLQMSNDTLANLLARNMFPPLPPTTSCEARCTLSPSIQPMNQPSQSKTVFTSFIAQMHAAGNISREDAQRMTDIVASGRALAGDSGAAQVRSHARFDLPPEEAPPQTTSSRTLFTATEAVMSPSGRNLHYVRTYRQPDGTITKSVLCISASKPSVADVPRCGLHERPHHTQSSPSCRYGMTKSRNLCLTQSSPSVANVSRCPAQKSLCITPSQPSQLGFPKCKPDDSRIQFIKHPCVTASKPSIPGLQRCMPAVPQDVPYNQSPPSTPTPVRTPKVSIANEPPQEKRKSSVESEPPEAERRKTSVESEPSQKTPKGSFASEPPQRTPKASVASERTPKASVASESPQRTPKVSIASEPPLSQKTPPITPQRVSLASEKPPTELSPVYSEDSRSPSPSPPATPQSNRSPSVPGTPEQVTDDGHTTELEWPETPPRGPLEKPPKPPVFPKVPHVTPGKNYKSPFKFKKIKQPSITCDTTAALADLPECHPLKSPYPPQYRLDDVRMRRYMEQCNQLKQMCSRAPGEQCWLPPPPPLPPELRDKKPPYPPDRCFNPLFPNSQIGDSCRYGLPSGNCYGAYQTGRGPNQGKNSADCFFDCAGICPMGLLGEQCPLPHPPPYSKLKKKKKPDDVFTFDYITVRRDKMNNETPELGYCERYKQSVLDRQAQEEQCQQECSDSADPYKKGRKSRRRRNKRNECMEPPPPKEISKFLRRPDVQVVKEQKAEVIRKHGMEGLERMVTQVEAYYTKTPDGRITTEWKDVGNNNNSMSNAAVNNWIRADADAALKKQIKGHRFTDDCPKVDTDWEKEFMEFARSCDRPKKGKKPDNFPKPPPGMIPCPLPEMTPIICRIPDPNEMPTGVIQCQAMPFPMNGGARQNVQFGTEGSCVGGNAGPSTAQNPWNYISQAASIPPGQYPPSPGYSGQTLPPPPAYGHVVPPAPLTGFGPPLEQKLPAPPNAFMSQPNQQQFNYAPGNTNQANIMERPGTRFYMASDIPPASNGFNKYSPNAIIPGRPDVKDSPIKRNSQEQKVMEEAKISQEPRVSLDSNIPNAEYPYMCEIKYHEPIHGSIYGKVVTRKQPCRLLTPDTLPPNHNPNIPVMMQTQFFNPSCAQKKREKNQN